MTYRATFTLEPDAFAFLKQMGAGNRSAYINALLKKGKTADAGKSRPSGKPGGSR